MNRLKMLELELIGLRNNLDDAPKDHGICEVIRSRMLPIQGTISVINSLSSYWIDRDKSRLYPVGGCDEYHADSVNETMWKNPKRIALLDHMIDRVTNFPRKTLLDSRSFMCLPNWLRWAEETIEFAAFTPRNNIALVSLPKEVHLSDYLCLIDTLFENTRDTAEGNGTEYDYEYDKELERLEIPQTWRTSDLQEDIMVHLYGDVSSELLY